MEREKENILIETHPDLTCTPTWPQWQLWDCPSHSTMLWWSEYILKCVYVCAWIQREGDSMKVHHTLYQAKQSSEIERGWRGEETICLSQVINCKKTVLYSLFTDRFIFWSTSITENVFNNGICSR